jgi:hypothetical protein
LFADWFSRPEVASSSVTHGFTELGSAEIPRSSDSGDGIPHIWPGIDIPPQITIDDLETLRRNIQQSMILTRNEVNEKAKRVQSYVEGLDVVREIITRPER